MAAMDGRALAPMFLHPRQYGRINLERAYFKVKGYNLRWWSYTKIIYFLYNIILVNLLDYDWLKTVPINL